ncbi:MAG TPA: S53 family peptidase [Pseudonocardiaceae bacterium]|nr:S53 family peptidase [Pseudonocardiaceae bacterium]
MRKSLILAIVPLAVAALALPSAAAPGPAATDTATSLATQPNPEHIATLKAVLQTMKDNYPRFARQTPGPQDVFDYNLGDLWLSGIDGSGTTIALIEGWDDPDINTVIHNFDARYGLPDPDIQTIFPSGPLPAECPAGMVALQSYGSCDAWMGELRLDVEAAHLIAPYAKILISASPADSEITDDTPFQVAMPELMHSVEFISENHLADSMSISDGTGEATYSDLAQIHSQDPGPLTAAADGVPVIVATGDCGVVQNLAVANAQCGTTTTTPDTAAWDDSPWVVAMGGSVPNVSTTDGSKLGPDPLWHAGIFSEGAGFSSVYARPDYQNNVKNVTGSDMRSVPDITMDSQDGTSESAPEFAGILALAAQLNGGRSVGPINDVLYRDLGPRGTRSGIEDVVSGNNSTTTVPGFTATNGFDVASGWGTLDASTFVPALVNAVRGEHGNDTMQRQAAAALDKLQHATLTSDNVPAGGTTYLLGSGFIPQHPVRFAIDGKQIATLTANNLGAVTSQIDPAALSLAPGTHTVTLSSMLLDESAGFRTR